MSVHCAGVDLSMNTGFPEPKSVDEKTFRAFLLCDTRELKDKRAHNVQAL